MVASSIIESTRLSSMVNCNTTLPIFVLIVLCSDRPHGTILEGHSHLCQIIG